MLISIYKVCSVEKKNYLALQWISKISPFHLFYVVTGLIKAYWEQSLGYSGILSVFSFVCFSQQQTVCQHVRPILCLKSHSKMFQVRRVWKVFLIMISITKSHYHSSYWTTKLQKLNILSTLKCIRIIILSYCNKLHTLEIQEKYSVYCTWGY